MVSLADETFSKVEWQKLEEELTCSSCGNLFLEPKTLSCLHTFCTKCIHDRLDSARDREPDLKAKNESKIPLSGSINFVPKNEPKNTFSCFVCNAEFSEKELDNIPKNVSMERLVSILKKRRTYLKATNEKEVEKDEDASDFTVTCSQCEEGTPATKWCLTCEDAEMCDECYKSHCRLKVYKSHKIIELEEFIESPSYILNCRPLCSNPLCKNRNTQPLELHCKECHMFVCRCCITLPFCKCQLGKKHDLESVNDVYEAKMEKIKEANVNIHAAQQRVIKKLEHIKCTSQELNRVISEEVLWVQERFQEIRMLVDKYEKDLLLDLETIRTTRENLLVKWSANLSQHEKRLERYRRFTSGMLLPFRFQEVLMYSDWIPKYLEDLDDDDEPVYKPEDMVISRGSFDLDDFTHKLLSLHQIGHNPHFPNCTVKLLSENLALVKVEVILKDKYGLPVPNQESHLDVQSEKNKSFFIKLSWKYKGKGIYILSYCPVKEPHGLSITWKDAVLGGVDLIYDFVELTKIDSFCRYNKRGLVTPLFLASTSENRVIISDPGDRRLIVTYGSFNYNHVITNYNYPDFHPAGVAIGVNSSCIYVANSTQNCILRYDKHCTGTWCNFSSSRFGMTGTKDGKFQCPQGLAMSKHGFLYICDRDNHRIQVYNTANNQENFYCVCSQEEGHFNHPTDIALNKEEDKVFVTDTDNHKVQVFTLPSPFSTMCYAYFIDFVHMQKPFGICCTGEGLLWVTSSDHVFIFREDGSFSAECKFDDKGPAGIIATGKEVIIALTESRSVVRYALNQGSSLK